MPIDQIEDISRPEGWGREIHQMSKRTTNFICSGGTRYRVDKMVTASFAAGRSKAQVYSEGVSAVLRDLIQAIEKPDHALKVTLEDGLSSLRIAVQATRRGRSPSR